MRDRICQVLFLLGIRETGSGESAALTSATPQSVVVDATNMESRYSRRLLIVSSMFCGWFLCRMLSTILNNESMLAIALMVSVSWWMYWIICVMPFLLNIRKPQPEVNA